MGGGGERRGEWVNERVRSRVLASFLLLDTPIFPSNTSPVTTKISHLLAGKIYVTSLPTFYRKIFFMNSHTFFSDSANQFEQGVAPVGRRQSVSSG